MKDLIDELQNKNICVLGLTTRNIDFVFCAIKQLDSLNIDFQKTSPLKKTIYFEEAILYRKGILFANGANKGQVLDKFFKKIKFFPKSIVYFDDKLKYIKEVEKFCENYKIPYLGFRYGFLDEKIKNFDSKIADIQHKHFKILSDEEAKKMLN